MHGVRGWSLSEGELSPAWQRFQSFMSYRWKLWRGLVPSRRKCQIGPVFLCPREGRLSPSSLVFQNLIALSAPVSQDPAIGRKIHGKSPLGMAEGGGAPFL